MKIFGSAIVMLFGLFGEVWAQTSAEVEAVSVAVVPIALREVAAGQSFIGTVTASKKSLIGSAVDGRVVEMLVDDGDPVTVVPTGDPPRPVGQPIAQLLTETISIEIAAARAQHQLRQQELAELEAGSRPEEIEQAKARLAAAKALNDYAQSRHQRLKTLYEQARSTSREDFEEAMSAALAAEQNRLAAQAAYDLAVKGPRSEQIEQARARLAAAQEEVNRLQDMMKKYTVRAPFEGFVIAKHTEVGAWLSRGDPVAEVVQLDPIEVRVSIPEAYIPHVRMGAEVRVRLEASPDDVIVGQVARIVPQADLRSRTFPVIVRLPNPRQEGEYLMKAGMLAAVTLGVGRPVAATLVPKDALVLDGRDTSIVVVDSDPRTKQPVARVVPVQLGVAEGSLIQVFDASGSLRDKQQVVVRGNERLRSGQPLQIVQFSRAGAPRD